MNFNRIIHLIKSYAGILYKTLNAALSTQNIHMIFLFRSFISDIHRQLQRYKAKHSLRIYRSQMISNAELETLKQCLGQFIYINSFFSTSTDYWKALSFLDISDVSNDLERVLFEIETDPRMVTISNQPITTDRKQKKFLLINHQEFFSTRSDISIARNFLILFFSLDLGFFAQ